MIKIIVSCVVLFMISGCYSPYLYNFVIEPVTKIGVGIGAEVYRGCMRDCFQEKNEKFLKWKNMTEQEREEAERAAYDSPYPPHDLELLEQRRAEREREEKDRAAFKAERAAYEKQEAERLEIRRRACRNAGCRQADGL